jgi:hypothetical protein
MKKYEIYVPLKYNDGTEIEAVPTKRPKRIFGDSSND